MEQNKQVVHAVLFVKFGYQKFQMKLIAWTSFDLLIIDSYKRQILT